MKNQITSTSVHETQLAQVRKHLKKYKKITSWTAIEKYRITRLSEYIRRLRVEEKLPISMTWKQTEDGKRFGLYKLESCEK